MKVFFSYIFFFSIILFSCSKKELKQGSNFSEVEKNNGLAAPKIIAVKPASVSIFNIGNTGSSQEMSCFFIINTLANSHKYQFFINSISLGNESFSYLDISKYYGLYPAKYQFTLQNIDDKTDKKTMNINFEKNTAYSLYIIQNGEDKELVQIKDQSLPPTKDSVKIRFANFSQNIKAVDFYIANTNQLVASNVNISKVSEFISLKAANNIAFDICEAGTTSKIARSPLVSLYALSYYTIFSSGNKNLQSPEGKLRVETIKHF